MTTRWLAVASLLLGTSVFAQQDAGPAEDLLTFSAGALPVAFGTTGAPAADLEAALSLIDGSPRMVSVLTQAAPDAGVWFVYQLPARTTFTRFTVPDVRETPSAFQTFFRDVVVSGSTESADAGFVELGRATLSPTDKGQASTLTMQTPREVRWVKVSLSGGLDVKAPKSTLHFTELVGEGTQATPARSEGFKGGFRFRGDALDLIQDGPVVKGCFDGEGQLEGTVAGPVLRARGVATRTGVVSLWVLLLTPEGLRGVRSTNGAPFRVVDLTKAELGPREKCPKLPIKKLSCGAVLHGLRFAYDSATLLPGSEPLLDRLASGLEEDGWPTAQLEGHSSSEGDAAYNLALSRRRAETVVSELVKRGVPAAMLKASGRGESTPIATNDDEAGRSLNRRVEVRCDGVKSP